MSGRIGTQCKNLFVTIKSVSEMVGKSKEYRFSAELADFFRYSDSQIIYFHIDLACFSGILNNAS